MSYQEFSFGPSLRHLIDVYKNPNYLSMDEVDKNEKTADERIIRRRNKQPSDIRPNPSRSR